MTLRSAARLGLLLALAAPLALDSGVSLAASKKTAAQGATKPNPSASLPQTAPPQKPRNRVFVDGVEDTGQFLPDTALLGRINDRPLTVRDFVVTYFAAYAPDRPNTDSAGRVEWLNSMVHKEILGSIARRAARPFGFEERLKLREHTQRVLSNTLFTRAVMDSIRIDDREVREIYDREFHVVHRIKHVMLPDRFPAEDVLKQLRAKTITWSEAVKKYSISDKDPGPDGELGWVQRMTLGGYMTAGILPLKPGEIAGPFADRDGYHVVQLVERKETEAPLFESVEKAIRNELRNREVGRLAGRLIETLREQSQLRYDTTAILWATQYFKPAMTSQRGEQGETDVHFNARLPVFAAKDTSRILARYKEGTLSLGRLTIEYGALSPFTRPSVNTFDGMRAQIDAIVLEPYRAQLALERGLDKDPIAVAQIEKMREQLMVERMYQDSVEARIVVSAEERRRYYDKNIAQFFTYPTAHYAALLAPDSAGAEKLADRLRKGEKAADILRADSIAGRERTGYIRDERENQSGPLHVLLFMEMKPGDITVWGPDRNRRWVAVQLLSFDSGRQLSYDESKTYADENLRAIKSEELLRNLLARHRSSLKVELYPEKVMRVRMVDPTTEM